jgi:hypothetical protein
MSSSALQAVTLLALLAPLAWAQQPPTTPEEPMASGPVTLPALPPHAVLDDPVPPLDLVPPTGPSSQPRGELPPGAFDTNGFNPFGSSAVPGGGHAAGLAGMFSPILGHALYRASYGFTEFFDENVKGQNTSLGFFRENAAFSGPIWQDDHNEWTAAAHVREEAFHTGGTILPDTGQAFPSELWDVRFSSGYRHLFDNGWIAGASVSFGSASDKPFHSINEMTAGVNASLRVPVGERNAFLFTLNYSATSEINVPIPGVAFLYNPSDCFQAILGFPFVSVNYRPTDDLTLSVSYALLTNFNARATYRLAPKVRIYTAFNVENESYFRVGRLDDRDRLFYYDDKVTGGTVFTFTPWMSLDVSGGYVFNRYYFEGRSHSDRNTNRIDIGEGPFLGANLQFRY